MSLQTSGRSAVFYGAEEGDLEVVKLLIRSGANLSLKDKVLTEAQSHSQTVSEDVTTVYSKHKPFRFPPLPPVLLT